MHTRTLVTRRAFLAGGNTDEGILEYNLITSLPNGRQLSNDSNDRKYGVSIVLIRQDSAPEEAIRLELSANLQEIWCLIDLLARNEVTPVTMLEILADHGFAT